MTFGDLIRAIKSDLKKDPSIIFDYDWERLMSYKEFYRCLIFQLKRMRILLTGI